MNFNDYQALAGRTAIYPGQETAEGLHYVTLGLCGEAGEVAEKVKKAIRDAGGEVDEQRREALIKELGDVLWYTSQIAEEINVPLQEVAKRNIDKLAERARLNKLHGDGSDR